MIQFNSPSSENGNSVEPRSDGEWCNSPMREPSTDMLAM